MNSKTCSLCGVFVSDDVEMCETCRAMMSGEPAAPPAASPSIAPAAPTAPAYHEFDPDAFTPVGFEAAAPPPHDFAPSRNVAAPPNESYYPVESASAPAASDSSADNPYRTNFFPVETPPADDFRTPEFESNQYVPEEFAPPPPAASAPEFPAGFARLDEPAPAADFPNGFARLDEPAAAPPPFGAAPPPSGAAPPPRAPRPPRTPPPIQTEYKPSFRDWLGDLPTLVKVGIGVFIFSIIFAVVLKGFMQMDLTTTGASTAGLEKQKPWFSAWFRATPTADEVFDKYERETFTKNKSVSAQSYFISGKAQIIPRPPGGHVDLNALKQGVPKPQPTVPTFQLQPGANGPELKPSNAPRPSDFEIDFEMTMKNPNKVLMKMNMRPKDGFRQTFKAVQVLGFDGEVGFQLIKTYVNGNENTREEKFQPNGFLFNRAPDGISMTSVRAMYSSAEMAGEEIVFNRRAYKLAVVDAKGDQMNFMFDVETGLIVKMTRPGQDVFVLEHNNFNGILYPSKMVQQFNGEWVVMEITKLQADAAVEDSIFQRASYR